MFGQYNDNFSEAELVTYINIGLMYVTSCFALGIIS